MRLLILAGILCLLAQVGYADEVGSITTLPKDRWIINPVSNRISNRTLICDPEVEIYCLEKHFFLNNGKIIRFTLPLKYVGERKFVGKDSIILIIEGYYE